MVTAQMKLEYEWDYDHMIVIEGLVLSTGPFVSHLWKIKLNKQFSLSLSLLPPSLSRIKVTQANDI